MNKEELEKSNEEELKKLAEETKARQFNPFIGGIQGCHHCYCGRGVWNNREHLVCCICGHRTLVNPITF